MAALANHLLRPVLQEMQVGGVAPATVRERASPRRSWWQRAFGGRGQTSLPMAVEARASGTVPQTQPATAMAQFASDPDFADLIRDPATFNVRDLEAAVTERAEARARAGRAELRAAAADYKRLAALVGLYDIKKARAAYARAAEIDPRDADALYWLGKLAMDAGNTREAEAAFLRLDALQGADIDPDDAIWGHIGLGDLRRSQGQLASALIAYRKGVDQADRLAKADPDNAGWQRDLSVSYDRVGDVLIAQGNLPDALKAFRDSLAMVDRLAKADPDNAGWQRDLSVSYDRVGDVLVAQGNLPAALDAFKASHDIFERLAKADPDNTGWQRDLSVSNERVGDMHARQQQTAEAITAFEGALRAYNQLLKRNPDDVPSRVFSVVPLLRLGQLRGKEGRKELEAALAILKPLADADRLDANRRGWVATIERQIAALDKVAAE
jgi:tetratricopeptide (TPR) repeat protein